MKRTLLIIVVLCLGGILFAATSVLSSSSYGLFGTPIDAASNAGQGFLDLDKTYIFAGLANLEQTPVIDSTSNAGGVDRLGGVELGAYFDSERPWSLFTDLYHDSSTWVTGSKSTTNTYGVPVSIGSNTYQVLSSTVERKNYGSFAEEIDDSAQYLTEMNGMVVGGMIRINTEDTSGGAGSGYKQTTTRYYNAAGAGSIPDAKVDYTIEEEERRRFQDFRFDAWAPLFMPGEKVDQTFSAAIGFGSSNNGSGKGSKIHSTPVNSTPALTDILHDDVKDKARFFQVGGSYRQAMTSPFMEGETKDFYFGGSLHILFNSPAYETLNETQRYTHALVGTTVIRSDSTYSYASDEIKYGLNTSTTLSGHVGHRFDFDLGDGFSLALNPSVRVNLSRQGDEKAKSRTEITKTDTNSDGVVDTTITVTTEYENMSDPITNSNRSISSAIKVDILPVCAFKYQPEKWKVGFTLGAQFDLSMEYTTIKQKVGSVSTTTKTESSAGTTIGVREDFYGSDRKTHTMDWVATLNHSFSMNWDIAENATLYADLGATVGSGIFDIGNLTVQAVISLP